MGSEKRHTDTVQVLLNSGVMWDEPAADGKTPLEITQNEDTKRVLQDFKTRTEKAAAARARHPMTSGIRSHPLSQRKDEV